MKLFIDSEKHAGTLDMSDITDEYPFLLEEFGFGFEQSPEFYIPEIKYITRDIDDSTPVSWILNFVKEIGRKCECVVTLTDNETENGGLILIHDDYTTEWIEDSFNMGYRQGYSDGDDDGYINGYRDEYYDGIDESEI